MVRRHFSIGVVEKARLPHPAPEYEGCYAMVITIKGCKPVRMQCNGREWMEIPDDEPPTARMEP